MQANPISIALGNCRLSLHNPLAQAIRFLKNQSTAFLRNMWRSDFINWLPVLRIMIPTITQVPP